MRSAWLTLFALLVPAAACAAEPVPPQALFAAQTPPTPPPPDATTTLTGVPADVLYDAPSVQRGGQQHWVAVNFSALQPTAGRVGLKVWDRPNGSLWLEAYGGGELFNGMYGFGGRLQYTLLENGLGDRLMVGPGLGLHVLPDWDVVLRGRSVGNWGHHRYFWAGRNDLYYLAGDVDVAWLHDFTPHVGFELGAKLGVAGKLGGRVGDDYPCGLMWGRNFFPLVAVYSGLRF